MKLTYILWLAFGLFLISGCGTKKDDQKQTAKPAQDSTISKKSYEAISLLGDTLYAINLPAEIKVQYDSALQVAKKNYQENPKDINNLIWLGRRLAYLSHYQQAIRVFSDGIRQYPDSPEFYRHRGHRYITTRQFEKAIKDLEKSAELAENMPITIEPDGIPLPLPADDEPSTLQFNIWYHLGIAYYLKGAYGKAAEAYEKCLTFCEHDDEIAATADWLYMTYRRLGEDEVAEKTLDMIREDMHLQENEGYFERLLMYKGLVEPDSLLRIDENTPLADRDLSITTQGYGVGNYYLINGEADKGEKILQDVVDSRYWAAFSYIAAEADLARMKNQ